MISLYVVMMTSFLCFSSYADGGYLGIKARYERTMIRNTFSGSATNLSNFTFKDTGTVPVTGVSGGLFGGYGKVFHPFYAGIEIGGELSSAGGGKIISVLNGINSAGAVSARKDYAFSLCFRAGIPLSDKTLAYIKGGGVITRYRFGSALQSVANGVDVNGNGNKRLVQGIWGMGLETEIAPAIRLGLDYESILEKSVCLPVSSSQFQGISHFSPGSDSVSIRIIFDV